MTHVINCRSKKSVNCYDGRPEEEIYPDGVDDDNTYDAVTDTVICDPCYIEIGQPLMSDPLFRSS